VQALEDELEGLSQKHSELQSQVQNYKKQLSEASAAIKENTLAQDELRYRLQALETVRFCLYLGMLCFQWVLHLVKSFRYEWFLRGV
jgi:hypothetical protein